MKTLLLLPLLLALATAPLSAQTNPPQTDTAAVSNELAQTPAPLTSPHLDSPWHEHHAGDTITPLAAVVMPFATAIVIISLFFYFRHRRNQMLHETLRAMIDKGVPIPPELLQPPRQEFRRRERNDLRAAIIMMGVGLGLLLAHLYIPGFIVFCLGLAFLAVWKLDPKPNPNQNGSQPQNQI